MTHTPGPWRIDPAVYPESPKIYPDNGSANFAYIARVNAGRDEFQANARLIAAAPDLLEALEKLMRKGSIATALEDDERDEISALLGRARARGEG